MKTLKRGRNLLNRTIEKLNSQKISIFPGKLKSVELEIQNKIYYLLIFNNILINNFFQGEIAWKLYDTYGFPVDLTLLMVEEKKFTVDMAAYEKARKLAQVNLCVSST